MSGLKWLALFATGWLLLLSDIARGDEIEGRIGFSIGQVSPGGVSVYVPGKWGILHVHLINPTEEPKELFAATYFEGEPTLQFGRRLWVPGRSQIQTWQPVLLPAEGTNGTRQFDFRTLVMDASHEREVLIRGDSGYLQLDGTVRVTDKTPVTGMIDTLDSSTDPNSDIESAYELLAASRVETVNNRRITQLPERILPAEEEFWRPLDQLVIADGRMVDDGEAMAAIRRWLFGGGHLWVTLDRVDPRVLERLLGDSFACQVVDRVGLTSVRIDSGPASGTNDKWSQDHDQPVDFVRVEVADVEVAYTVNGWPAAFWKTCGEGRLLVTTLGARGWMRLRTAADIAKAEGSSDRFRGPPAQLGRGPAPQRPDGSPPGRPAPPQQAPTQTPPPDPPAVTPPARPNSALIAENELRTRYIPLEPALNLAGDFFSSRLSRLLPNEMLESQVQEYVGYSIPPRWLITSLLAAFCLLLAVMGLGFWRRNRLEFLGAMGPGSAVVFSIALVFLGRQQRQAIPATVASVQLVRAVPGTDDVRIEGVAGLFSPEGGTATIGATQGGWLLPEMTGQQGTTRRMVWTDLGVWQWENLPETAGLRSATFSKSGQNSERLEARAAFGPEGLTGRLHAASAHRPADAVLATRFGRIGVDLRDDGTFVARSDNVFTPNQYLAAGLLSDEQHRRQLALEHLLTNPQRRDYPAEPQLLFWSDPWNLGFQFDEGRRSFGSALVAVPLKLERPATGTEVSIAAPLLPFRSTFGPDGMPPGGSWDNNRREWQEKAWASSTWLRFQIPPILLPVEVQRGRIVAKVTGPVVKLEIAGYRWADKSVVPIKTWTDPVGTLSMEITNSELISAAADGGLLLRVTGGDTEHPERAQTSPSRDEKLSYWRIESLTLELQIKTIEPSDLASGG
jgi:hypothetical protein